MDIVVGYVTYVFDDDTVKLHITHQDPQNKSTYSSEIKLIVAGWESMGKLKGALDAKIGLIYNLLCKKISVKILNNDTLGLRGKVQLLPELAA